MATLFLLYGLVSYLIFLVSLNYFILFTQGLWVPTTVDHANEASIALAWFIDVGLVALFALQHTVMARSRFKVWWTRIIPQPIERSTFVLATSLVLGLLCWQWRPIAIELWHVEQPLARTLLHTASWIGWGILLYTSYLIDHFDLFGLRQVFFAFRGKRYEPPAFREPYAYRLVRHPMMVGILLGLWAIPTMTVGHLLLNVSFTLYVLMGTTFEETELLREHGESYRAYQQRVPKLIPFLGNR